MSKKRFPIQCPACDKQLFATSLHCKSCDTNVNGSYELPLLARLTNEEQLFVLQFLKASGSIKELASQMAMSYPTMRNILDDLIEKVKKMETTTINDL